MARCLEGGRGTLLGSIPRERSRVWRALPSMLARGREWGWDGGCWGREYDVGEVVYLVCGIVGLVARLVCAAQEAIPRILRM